MKLQVRHLATGAIFTSDEFGVEMVDEIYETVKLASSSRLENLRVHIDGNLTFIPSKVLDESIITIIEE